MADTPKQAFQKMASEIPTPNPPPIWPDFPPELAKKFPDWAKPIAEWNAKVKEFFRQQSNSNQ